MLSLLLAAVSAGVWGTADFLGGKASQRAPALVVSIFGKVAALPVLVAGVALTGGRPTAAGLGWGALAGGFGMAGVILLYRGLATGAMSTVAPVTAVTSALVPFTLGILLDGVPRAAAIVGAVCAVGAIALVSTGGNAPTEPHRRVDPGIVGLALAAGVGFGLFMTFLSRTRGAPGTDPGLWPLTTAQLSALGLGLVLLRRCGAPLRLGRAVLRWTVGSGVLGTCWPPAPARSAWWHRCRRCTRPARYCWR